MGAVENFQSKAFISFVFFVANRSYKGLDRPANPAQASLLDWLFQDHIRSDQQPNHHICILSAHESPSAYASTFTRLHSAPGNAGFRWKHSFPNSHRNVSDAMKRRERFTFNRNKNRLWQ